MWDYLKDTPEQRAERIAQDLHDLRVLAWLVKRGRYNREPRRVDGGRRGSARVASYTFYAEPADVLEADRAVREAMKRRDET